MDVLLIRANFTTEWHAGEIKIRSPRSCAIGVRWSYTLLTLSRLTKFHHHTVSLSRRHKKGPDTATQDKLLLSAKVSSHHIVQLLYRCSFGSTREKNKSEKSCSVRTDHICVIRHKSVSLSRPISCVWNKKVIPFVIRGRKRCKKWVSETKEDDSIYFPFNFCSSILSLLNNDEDTALLSHYL